MRYNPQLKGAIYSYFGHTIIVEGKKDKNALVALGFERVFELHQTGVSLRERLEQIARELDKKEKVCILTDLDKKGKDLYMKSKTILQELGVHLDSSLRGLLIKGQVSHVEGIYKFLEKIDKIG
jgi:5S rRNA maturation endonuclease (ribonuclease M5)